MVMRISAWRPKICSKLWASGQYTPDMFVKCQWQRTTGISLYYLVYRWVMALVFLSILVASMVGMGRKRGDLVHYAKWPIYLTHWGFCLCTLQAIVGAYLITRAKYSLSGQDIESMKMNRSLRVYWVIHHCATVGAFTITATYWCFVFDPAEHRLDALNILVHACNSILMMVDLIFISHPIRLKDFYWPLIFAVSYVIFNYIYYLAGGTDRKGRTYIYKILDWRNPGRTVIIVQLCILFMEASLFIELRRVVKHGIREQHLLLGCDAKYSTIQLGGAATSVSEMVFWEFGSAVNFNTKRTKIERLKLRLRIASRGDKEQSTIREQEKMAIDPFTVQFSPPMPNTKTATIYNNSPSNAKLYCSSDLRSGTIVHGTTPLIKLIFNGKVNEIELKDALEVKSKDGGFAINYRDTHGFYATSELNKDGTSAGRASCGNVNNISRNNSWRKESI